jgi:hypothetical protein
MFAESFDTFGIEIKFVYSSIMRFLFDCMNCFILSLVVCDDALNETQQKMKNNTEQKIFISKMYLFEGDLKIRNFQNFLLKIYIEKN